MLCPLIHSLLCCVDIGDAVIAGEFDDVGGPIDGVFDAAGDVAEHLVFLMLGTFLFCTSGHIDLRGPITMNMLGIS